MNCNESVLFSFGRLYIFFPWLFYLYTHFCMSFPSKRGRVLRLSTAVLMSFDWMMSGWTETKVIDDDCRTNINYRCKWHCLVVCTPFHLSLRQTIRFLCHFKCEFVNLPEKKIFFGAQNFVQFAPRHSGCAWSPKCAFDGMWIFGGILVPDFTWRFTCRARNN